MKILYKTKNKHVLVERKPIFFFACVKTKLKYSFHDHCQMSINDHLPYCKKKKINELLKFKN